MFEHSRLSLRVLALGSALTVLSPGAVAAYGGPGSVVTGIGALLAALAAVAAAIFGFFWFPLKKLARKIRGDEAEGERGRAEATESPASE